MLLRRENFKHPEFRQGVTDMMGVATGIAAWGLMTGVAMVKSGMSTAEALLMAAIVFAGSSQLAAIPLILAGAPIWVVNLRFVVFSVHMRPYVMHLPLRDRLLAGYLTGDLTYVLFVKRFAHPPTDDAGRVGQMAYLVGNGGLNWVSWTTFSILGVVLANAIPAQWGLGFAGILALLGMLCSLASTKLRWMSAAVAGTAAVAAFALPLKLNILVAIAASVVVCLLLEKTALHARPATPTDGGH